MFPFLRPNYGHGCFADLPPLIRHCLTGQPVSQSQATLWGDLLRPYDAVILVLIDGFGWRFYERFAGQDPCLKRFAENGAVLRWTSQFPSTTAAHMTCLHTGLPVGQSGVFEWQYYEPALDAVIEPLTYSFAGDRKRETLAAAGVQPAALFPAQTFYQALAAQGVTSYVYQHREYTPSSYSDWVMRGAQVTPVFTLPEALVNLRQQLAHASSPSYFVVYFDKIDTLGHYYGPDSAQQQAEVETDLFALERVLLQPLQGKASNTLFILTADHGQMEINPRTTIYLNTDPRFEGFRRFLRTDRQGRTIVPGGSPRDVFLYIEPALLDEAHRFFADRLAGKADVVRTQELVEQGYFGPPPLAPALLGRLGDLVLLAYPGESIWWYEKDRFESRFYGHHGGLTAAEMEIPVCLLPLMR
jgi:hypothetical protein